MTTIRETFLPDDGCVLVRCDLCLVGDTLIETLQGPKAIKEIKKGEKVLTFRDCRVAWGVVTKTKDTGVHKIWRVTLDDGSIIEGTKLHRFLVVRNWGGKHKGNPRIEEVCLKDLRPKDRLVPLRGLNHRVVKVEETQDSLRTYSITVEPDHNYALSCGVFVSNSQIEDRMCKMYCGTPRMVELANRKPWEYDAHTDNAALIFKKAHAEITKDERYLGKRTTHASQRGMRGARLSENISKDTEGRTFLHPKQCDRLIDSYLEAMWEIRDVYFPWVRQQIRDVGVLYDSWGGRLDLRNRRIDDDLYREGYSYYMQSECARWTNQYGFLPGHYWMMGKYGRPLNAQVHDELIASVPVGGAWEYARFIVGSLEQKREIPKGSGNWLCVPAEVTVGRSWGDKEAVEFKRLPGGEGEFYRELEKGGFKLG